MLEEAKGREIGSAFGRVRVHQGIPLSPPSSQARQRRQRKDREANQRSVGYPEFWKENEGIKEGKETGGHRDVIMITAMFNLHAKTLKFTVAMYPLMRCLQQKAAAPLLDSLCSHAYTLDKNLQRHIPVTPLTT